MPLLGHGNEIKSPNRVYRGCRIGHSDACEPWGYVAPVVAAVVTRATGVRHIYLIVTPDQISIGHDLENSFEPSYFLLLSFMHDH